MKNLSILILIILTARIDGECQARFDRRKAEILAESLSKLPIITCISSPESWHYSIELKTKDSTFSIVEVADSMVIDNIPLLEKHGINRDSLYMILSQFQQLPTSKVHIHGDHYYFRETGMLDAERGDLYVRKGNPPKVGSKENEGRSLNALKPVKGVARWFKYKSLS